MSALDDAVAAVWEVHPATHEHYPERCAEAVLVALRALPVEERMAAMGMEEVVIGGFEYEIDWKDGSPVRADWNEMTFWTRARPSD